MSKNKENLEEKLAKSFARWEHLYKFGGQDPFWADGVNLNLVRNHIFYYKSKIEEAFQESEFPEIYFREIPSEVPHDYMARTDEIMLNARRTLETYLLNDDYLYVEKNKHLLTEKTKEKLHVDAVCGYVYGLRKAIEEDDLITMRRHESAESYIDSFSNLKEKMMNIEPEDVQLDLFSLPSYETHDDFEMENEEEFCMSM